MLWTEAPATQKTGFTVIDLLQRHQIGFWGQFAAVVRNLQIALVGDGSEQPRHLQRNPCGAIVERIETSG